MKTFILHIFLFGVLTLGAQVNTESKKALKFYEKGLGFFQEKNFMEAEQNLKKAIDEDPAFQAAYMVLAEAYWDKGLYGRAAETYGKGLAVNPNFYPLGYMNKGKLEMLTANYDSAVKSYQTYIALTGTNNKYYSKAKFELRCAEFSKQSVENPVQFAPVNLGANVNSADDEYWPTLSADEQKLIITRRLGSGVDRKMQQEDFFYSIKKDTTWTKMLGVGKPLNTPGNEGAQSISADGNTMVYTVCNRKGVGRCDLFISYFRNNEWTEPVSLGIPVNTAAKETQPSLSPDGRTLYFASDRNGTKGGLDLWKSTLNDDGKWSNPINLGDSINNAGEQMAPFIHHDGRSLYFASDSHIGLGRFDIYLAKQDSNENFSNITNLGYPINTNGDEFGLVVNAKGNMAYYSSTVSGFGGRDIFRFEIPEKIRPTEVSYLKGKVFDNNNYTRLSASFQLIDLENGAKVSQSESNEKGEFLVCIPSGKNYMLNVSKEGYLFYSDNFSFKGIFHFDEPFTKDIPLSPIIPGESIVLKNIFFETDAYVLKPSSKLELNKLVTFLSRNTTLNIEISGHTDNKGSDAYNLELSERRAQSVVNYLTDQGIDRGRLTYKGYGMSVPLASNDTEEGRAKNRRTVLKILE